MRSKILTLIFILSSFNMPYKEHIPTYAIDLPMVVVTATHKKPKHVRDYFNTTYKLADSMSIEYNIPIEIIMSLACLEGNYGRSKWARINNNHFGIVQGKKYFKTKEACFVYLCKLLTSTKRYKSLVGEKNIFRYCVLLRDTGYNSEECYPKQLYSMIQYLSPLFKSKKNESNIS